MSVVHQTGFEPFERGRIAAEERHGDGIPDLTIWDTAGVVRVLVENKFWAGLTETQPVGYLDQLPPDAPAALLFVVPHTRLHIVWAELKGRCATKKIDLTDEAKTDDISWSRTGNRILAITSWKHVLAQLQQAASAGGHEAIEQDIIQLRGLTDQQNTAEFLPLREDEISSATLARRLLNYTSLIDEVVGRLVADGLASIKKTGPVCDYTCVGRGVRLHSRFGAWFGVDFKSLGRLRDHASLVGDQHDRAFLRHDGGGVTGPSADRRGAGFRRWLRLHPDSTEGRGRTGSGDRCHC